jgi:hypothetical protein
MPMSRSTLRDLVAVLGLSAIPSGRFPQDRRNEIMHKHARPYLAKLEGEAC